MLVGRESERRAIDALLAGARVGDSGVLVLTGEAGIGKTALLEDAASLLDSMRVLRVQGAESERSLPFAGLHQLLRPVLHLLDHIPRPQSRALAAALLLEPAADTDQSRFAVGAATLSLLCRAAEDQPLVVLVDDAQLLDAPTADAILFAARRVVSDAIAMVLTVRTEGAGSAPWSQLPTMTIPGLGIDAARQLVTGTSGSPVGDEQLVRLHRATAGNPLALLELSERLEQLEQLAGRPGDIPLMLSDELSRSFVRRAEDLGEEVVAALVVAAADGTSLATVLEVGSVLGMPRVPLTPAVDAGLIALDGDRVAFRHPLVRSAVYASAVPGRRREIHRAFASVLSSGDPDRLAWHLSEGATAPDEQTADTLDRVGERASRRGAHATAAAAHQRAAQLGGTRVKRAVRLSAAAEAAWLAGQTERAVQLIDAALGSDPDPALRVHLLELRGAVETRCGSLEAGLSTLLAAAGATEDADPDTAIRLLAAAVHACVYLADPGSAMSAARAIEPLLATAQDTHTTALGTMATGMAMILSGAGDVGARRMHDSALLLATSDVAAVDRFQLPLRLQGALWLRSSGPHRGEVREVIERQREQVALGSLPYLLMQIARDAATTDRWDDAEAAYLEGVRLARETGQSTELAVSLAGLAWLYARQGRAEECRATAADADELCRRNRIGLGSLWLDFARGDLAAGAGTPEAAIDHYERLLRTLTAKGLRDPDVSPAAELAEAYCHLGRAADALPVARELSRQAHVKGEPWSLARAHRALGLCESGAAGDGWFRSALELHAQTPDQFERARTELAFGAALRRRRRRINARPHLRSALDAFDRLGAVPWANRAARELQATGERAQRRESGGIHELTPQERQIGQLLAEGRTTRETAAALFISPKTVEYHLRHVYLKLGIRSRAALAEAFVRPVAADAQPGE